MNFDIYYRIILYFILIMSWNLNSLRSFVREFYIIVFYINA